MKRVPLLILLLTIFVALSPPANANPYVLTSGNSSASIDPASQAGMFNWTTDGVSLLYQQWFWYRVGSTGGEASLDTLPFTATQVGNNLDLLFTGTGFTIDVFYRLTGGTAGSNTADIAEVINITNTSTEALDFHFFQYSDFDLNRLNLSDRVHIYPTPGSWSIVQVPTGNGPMLSETSATSPNLGEAATYPATLNSLNDGSPTTLNGDLIAGPGDVTWALQWDEHIGARSSYIISKDKKLEPVVPEPAAIGLFGGVLLLVASKLRKRVA